MSQYALEVPAGLCWRRGDCPRFAYWVCAGEPPEGALQAVLWHNSVWIFSTLNFLPI